MVLLYSVEHVHVGLPYALATVPVDAQLFKATDMEAYHAFHCIEKLSRVPLLFSIRNE